MKGYGTAQQWTQTHGTSFAEVQVPCEYSNYRSLFLEFLREQNWSLLQVLTLWKAEIHWCSTITDSVAFERTSEIFPSIATRDSEFRAQWMHSTTSWNMPSVLHPTKMISPDICKWKGWPSAQEDAIFHQSLSTSLWSWSSAQEDAIFHQGLSISLWFQEKEDSSC